MMASLQTFNQAGDQNPPGIIIIWTGFLVDIPLGWVLCDGTNGTPDLRDRFTRGVPTAAINPGAVGGVTTVTLNTGNMSSHLHSGTGVNHSHLVRVSDVVTSSTKMILGGDGPDKTVPNTSSNKAADPIQTQGGNGAHNNMPLFYEVLYIQRT